MSHGPKITTLSSSIFSERATKAINAQPVRKTVYLSEIELINEAKISYKGSEIKISKQGFSDLLKLLKIPKAFVSKFNDIMKERPEARRQFINSIKNVMSSQGTGSSTVTLILSVEKKEIVAVRKNARDIISNRGFLDVVNNVIDNNSLDVVDFSIGKSGEVSINTVDVKNQWDVNGLKDEVFQSGVSFINNPKDGFIVSPYISRMVCANGMISQGFQEQYKLTSTDGNAMQKFFSDINNLAKKGFKPEQFVERVKDAISMKASLNEMYNIKRAIKRVVPDIKNDELESWVPVKYTEAAYARIGVDCKLLRSGQLKNAKTDTSLWDLINGLTHFSTHDNGFEISDYNRRVLQIESGRLLTDEHDLSNFVQSPF